MIKMIIGITGTFGAGKSTVSRTLSRITKAKILDADKIAKDMLQKKGIINEIEKRFPEALRDIEVDRKLLAHTVFKDKRKLSVLEKIIHPGVITNIRKEINDEKNFIIDAPLLIEAGLHKLCDIIIVVKCSEMDRIRRLEKKGFTKEEIAARTKRQLPLKEKIKYADYVIDNNGSLEEMRRQISLLTRKLFPAIGKSQRGHRIVFGGIS